MPHAPPQRAAPAFRRHDATPMMPSRSIYDEYRRLMPPRCHAMTLRQMLPIVTLICCSRAAMRARVQARKRCGVCLMILRRYSIFTMLSPAPPYATSRRVQRRCVDDADAAAAPRTSCRHQLYSATPRHGTLPPPECHSFNITPPIGIPTHIIT